MDILYRGVRFIDTTRINIMEYSGASPRSKDGYYEYLIEQGIVEETGRSKAKFFCTLDLAQLRKYCKGLSPSAQ